MRLLVRLVRSACQETALFIEALNELYQPHRLQDNESTDHQPMKEEIDR